MKKVNLLRNGFTRREDLDFTDDGAIFTAYEYNGLIITKTTYKGEYFISVRVDYLRGFNFIYDDYSEKDWYKLCDEFNGVMDVDVEKLKENMDIIKRGIEELEEEIKNDPIDNALLENRLLQEEKELKEFIEEHKMVDLTKYDEYEIKDLEWHFDRIKGELRTIQHKLVDKGFSRREYKRTQKYGYMIFDGIDTNYHTTSIMEILNRG